MPDDLGRHTILAIDPGPVPGVAAMFCTGGALPGVRTFAMDPEQLVAFVRQHAADFDLVVCERFTVGPRTAKATRAGASQTLSLIGQLQEAAGELLVMQVAGTVKPWATNDRLRSYAAYIPGDHHRDAARHALYAAVKRGWLPPRGPITKGTDQ